MALKDEYLTVSQAAEELEVTRQTISRWIAKKFIPVERVGRVALLKKEDLRKYHWLKLAGVTADSILVLYLQIAEDYCREKGYIKANTPTVHAEYWNKDDTSNIVYKLSKKDLDEVDKRFSPMLMGMLDQLRRAGIAVGKPKKNKEGGKKTE